ncbi:hypothetical protein Bca4012_058764 [Brassica carinata]
MAERKYVDCEKSAMNAYKDYRVKTRSDASREDYGFLSRLSRCQGLEEGT